MRSPFRILTLTLLLALAAGPAMAEKADFLVNADWLEQHIDDPDLVILEVRYHPHRYYTVGHIPGAVQVQRFKDLGDNSRNPIMHFPSREQFQESLRSWGVNDDSTIVLYDDSVTALATRVYFLLDLYGYDMDRVKLLDGGTNEWTAFNTLSTDAPEIEPGNVTLEEARDDLVVEWTDIYDDVVARRDDDVVLLDSRPEDHYTGETVTGAPRGGHIPGAINIVSLDGANGQTHLWDTMDELEELYADLPRDKTVYAYCHDGFRQTMAYMQLKALGFEDVRLYDGGWAHWGRAKSLPVVEGDKPLGGDFSL